MAGSGSQFYIGALATVAVFALGWLGLNLRRSVIVRLTSISSKVTLRDSATYLAASKIELHNKSIHKIEDFHLHIAKSTCIGWSVTEIKSVSKHLVTVENRDEYIDVCIASFPAREKIALSMFFDGHIILRSELSSGSANYRIVDPLLGDSIRSGISAGLAVGGLWFIFLCISAWTSYF